MARLRPLWSVAIAGALFAVFRTGFANWDTSYALVFGSEVASGRRPDFDGPALAPTTHPLADVVGLLLAGFGDAAEPMVVALGFLALGMVGYLVYRLAATWFGPVAGFAAAAVLLTREPVLSFGVRAYVDLPYLALVLGALALEVRRPRAGASVLALLFLAGLLRPEAWLFSLAYVVWLALPSFTSRRGADADEGEPVANAGPKRGRPPQDPTGGKARPLRDPAAEVAAPPLDPAAEEAGPPLDPTPEEARAYWEERRRREAARAAVPGEARRRATRLIPLALAAPVVWALLDLAATGDALASLTGTRENVETLGRATGLSGFVSEGPRKLGEILREPGLVAAVAGAGVGLVWLRRRTLAIIAAAAVALAAFAVVALAGLPVITRYLLLEAALLCVLCGAAVGGWPAVERGPRRWGWLAAAAVVVLLFAAFGPSQYDRVADLRASLVAQKRIQDDLHDLARDGAFPLDCQPITVPNSRPVPLLSLWLDRDPTGLRTAGEGRQPSRGVLLLPARPSIARQFALDDRDPGTGRLRRLAGFQLQRRNRSWRVYANCG